MNVGRAYPIRNALNNFLTTRTAVVPVCPDCNAPMKRILRTYVDDNDRDIQKEIVWKCKCVAGRPIPESAERHREDFPVDA